ncbi:MAG TPA: ABC transporter permease, partial [Anaerolineae bacterium]|nr:ABC transporter permease [Anaerolineae bacterium]
MNLGESLLTAIGSIGANKLRAALTMLGVIIGVGAVIALMALGNGVTESVTGEISSLGSNLISISTDRETSGGYAVLTLSDVEALSNPLSAPALSGASAIVQGGQEVVYGGESIDATVAGVTANYLEMNNMSEFQVGDGITKDDLDNKERVAVLGSDAALDLFGDNYALGKMVKVNGVSYEVVGILESQGSGFAGDTDGNIYVPITTAKTRLYPDRTRSGERAVSSIVAQTVSSDQTQSGEAQIQAVLREKHGLVGDDEDDFRLFS